MFQKNLKKPRQQDCQYDEARKSGDEDSSALPVAQHDVTLARIPSGEFAVIVSPIRHDILHG